LYVFAGVIKNNNNSQSVSKYLSLNARLSKMRFQ